jgi:molybdate/tungstate transport system substrate-binding protein
VRFISLLALSFLVGSGCQKSTELTVLHAASLRRAFADAAAAYEKANPKVRVKLEPSGSQVAIRKVTEHGLKADVVAVADAALIDKMMVPQHAEWNLEFATNEIVLAHVQGSRFTDEVTEANWPEVLLRQGVRLGRVNPDTAPLGYHTVFVWQLAERSGRYGASGEGLAQKLTAAVPAQGLAADETELMSQLEAKAVDYAFLYRSTAEDHRLKMVALPPELNLGHRELDERYTAAELEVKMKTGGSNQLRGHAITYGLTVPTAAANRAEAERFVAFLIGPEGQQIQTKAGFRPVAPAEVRPAERLSPALRALTAPAKE